MPETTIVGIHASGDRLYRAELRHSGRRMEIVRLEHMPMERPAARPSSDPTPERASDVRQADESSNSVINIASLPTPEVISRFWRLPATDDVKFKQVVAHRLEADLPIPLEQLIWDYRKAEQSSDVSTRLVLAQAARSERIKHYTESLSSAGIKVDTLTTEAEAIGALSRYGLKWTGNHNLEALILAGPDEWLIGVLNDGITRSLRRVPAGADHPELAFRQCRHSIEAEVPLREFGRVWWCGPPELDNTRQALAEWLGISVEPVEPADQLIDTDGQRISNGRLAEFGPAIGLTLVGLYEKDDIIRLAGLEKTKPTPGQQRIQRILAHPWRLIAGTSALMVLAAVIHVGAISWEKHKMQKLLDARSQTDSPMTALEPKMRAIGRLKKYRIDVEAIAADLCRVLPESIVLSSIQLSRERRLIIKGTSGDPQAIFALADALRKGDRFTMVNPERAEPDQGGGFTISAELVGIERFPSLGGRGAQWR